MWGENVYFPPQLTDRIWTFVCFFFVVFFKKDILKIMKGDLKKKICFLKQSQNESHLNGKHLEVLEFLNRDFNETSHTVLQIQKHCC